ncbi:MAG TPA: hypothetical protein VF765_09695 [Polyangiaceae bacterium]
MNARRLLVSAALPLLPALLAFACGGGNENLPPPPPPPAPPPAEAPPAAASAAPSASVETPPAPPPAPPPTLAQGTQSPDPPAPTPTVKFLAPAANQVIPAAKAGDFQVKLDVKNWKTAPGDAHVHLILDDKPYKPIYDTKAPVKLSDLPGGDALAPGQHILVAFPSRANHESVKTPGALAVLQFWVDKKGDVNQDVKKPMLIYSRPKGDYKGDMANHVLVDFYLANEKLSQGGDHVHITVTGPGAPNDGLTADATQWGPPFFLDSLQDGSYQVKLDLLDKDGKTVPGGWSSVTRNINVAHQAQ